MGLAYRARQFGHTVTAAPCPADLQLVAAVLSPALFDLYRAMSPADQVHCLRVYATLVHRGQFSPDLLAAALLHDVGKARHPLHAWERVWIVLARLIWPGLEERWGAADYPARGLGAGLRRPLIVARNHPEWGSALCAQAGASPLAVNLIRRHQEVIPPAIDYDALSSTTASLEERLLRELQAADGQN